MSLTATALTVIVASSFAWGGFDALRKLLASRVPALPLTALLTSGQLVLFLAWLLAGADHRISLGYALPGAVAIAINLTASVLFIKAVQISPLSLTIPLLSFTPVFSTLFSAALLGEWPRPLQLAGIGLAVLGALVLNLGGDVSPRESLRALLRERGCLYMLCVALLWSVGSVVDKAALFHASPAVHAAVQCAGITALLLLMLARMGRLRELRGIVSVPWVFLAAIAAASLALALQLFALRLALVGLVETIKRAIGMTLSLVNGRVFFHEPITGGKLAGVALLAGAVALILA
jgi:drug/metabolite transporter (DMT)-like permease